MAGLEFTAALGGSVVSGSALGRRAEHRRKTSIRAVYEEGKNRRGGGSIPFSVPKV